MKRSLFDLVRILMGDVRALLRQELMLLKAEFREKASRIKGDVMALAIGGLTASAGAMVLLMGLGLLLAWAFSYAGIPPLLAAFIGLALIGFACIAAGAVLLLKAFRDISKGSIVPEKSLETLRHLASGKPRGKREHRRDQELETESQLSSEELQKLAFATEGVLDKTLEEIGEHVSPAHIKERMKHGLTSKPVVGTALAVGAGLMAAPLMKRFRHD